MEQNTSVQSPAPAETANTPSPDESLSSLAKEFHVEEQARTFTATPSQPTYQPSQPYIPDPVTQPDDYKAWSLAQVQSYQQTNSALREISTQLSAIRQEREQQKIDADVGHAVKTVNSKLKVDDDLAEALLNLEYTKNPSFKRIWDNRDRNPEAYNRALGVLADKLYSKVQVRQDPQIAENVRAAQSSQRTMSTTNHKQNEEWANLSDAEFERKWRATLQGF